MNPRPQGPQPCALPTELWPPFRSRILSRCARPVNGQGNRLWPHRRATASGPIVPHPGTATLPSGSSVTSEISPSQIPRLPSSPRSNEADQSLLSRPSAIGRLFHPITQIPLQQLSNILKQLKNVSSGLALPWSTSVTCWLSIAESHTEPRRQSCHHGETRRVAELWICSV